MNLDRYYVAARRVLLDALEALADHRDAVIVAGAQAVYLRTGAANVGVAEFTTDGDLALASERLADDPLLEQVMGGGFEHHRDESSGAIEPGVWTRTVLVDDEPIEVPVDLIVPEGLAPPGGRRGVRLGVHGNRAARKAPGLEAALVDNDLMPISAVETADDRIIEARVAGPTALLIAKAHKIHDRLEEREQRPNRLINKDASDVYRLMVTTGPEQVNQVLRRLDADERVAEPARVGIQWLREQFGARRALGVEMAVDALRVGVPEDRIRAVCTTFISALS